MTEIVLHEGDNQLNIGMTSIAEPVADLSGLVTDAETGLPVEGVKVTIGSMTTYTDAIGQYRFESLPLGTYIITFEKEGYRAS